MSQRLHFLRTIYPTRVTLEYSREDGSGQGFEVCSSGCGAVPVEEQDPRGFWTVDLRPLSEDQLTCQAPPFSGAHSKDSAAFHAMLRFWADRGATITCIKR